MDADDLYGLTLERFVPERDALARALRADGRREQAADVARLRKPSIAAWAVNQLVRTQGRALADLFDAGDALRGAHTEVLAGRGDGRGFRAAADRERSAVDALVAAARGLLTSDGHELSPAIVDRVADTIHAAALDDDARARVRAGRVERELRHVGFGVEMEPGGAPTARAPKGKTPTKGIASAKRTAAQRLERERAKARKAARATESETGRRADRAARALEVAQERCERAAAALRIAEEALATARAEAETTNNLHRRAQQSLEGIERSAP